MKNKYVCLGIVVMALTFGITLIGCDNGSTNQENDTWSNVTTLDQMDGTWKAVYNQNNRPIKDVMKEQGVPWNSTMQELFGDMRVSSKAVITLTINASSKTQAMSTTSTTTYSGGNIETIWFMLRAGFKGSAEEDGMEIIFDDTSLSIIVAYNYREETMSEGDITEMLSIGFKINLDGTKIKVPANSLAQGLAELIFIKQ